MKTLCDLFQHQSFEYELRESDLFGTIGILYHCRDSVYAHATTLAAQDILDKAGAHQSGQTTYVPHLTDEEVLSLSATGLLCQYIGSWGATLDDVPTEVLVKFRRDQRGGLSNLWHDLLEKPDFRGNAGVSLTIVFSPWVVYGLVKLLF